MRIRTLARVLLVLAMLVVSAACNPLAGDEEATATSPPTPTREVIVATFTPTEVILAEDQTATAEAQATGAAQTATERALNPQPTPTFANPTVPPEDLLTPPMATLHAGDEEIPASLGSYGWVFGDTLGTVSAITAPIVQFEHDPVDVENGQEITISFSGREFRSPLERMDGGIYNFEDNSAFPTNQQGEVGDELAFVVNADPDQLLELDPSDPQFTIDVPPGHYAIRIQGHWPAHPQVTSTPIFATWIFNVNVQ